MEKGGGGGGGGGEREKINIRPKEHPLSVVSGQWQRRVPFRSFCYFSSTGEGVELFDSFLLRFQKPIFINEPFKFIPFSTICRIFELVGSLGKNREKEPVVKKKKKRSAKSE